MKQYFKCATLLLLGALNLQAVVAVSLTEVGSNLVMSTSGGTLDLSSLTYDFSYTDYGAGLFNQGSPNGPAIWVGGTPDTNNDPIGYVGTANFSGTGITADMLVADSAGLVGDHFGVQPGSPRTTVFVPSGYTSGNTISASSLTFNGYSLADFGWSVGDSATWSWSSDSITLTAVPEPAGFTALFGAIALAACCLCRRRGGKIGQT